jgi:hypothetical protein
MKKEFSYSNKSISVLLKVIISNSNCVVLISIAVSVGHVAFELVSVLVRTDKESGNLEQKARAVNNWI